MIAEFALTPAIFDETSHPDPSDWRMWLTVLGHRMFPQPNLCPVMVTNLSGLWEARAQHAVMQIKDSRTRGIAQQLFTRIMRLVRRKHQGSSAQLTRPC